MDALATDERRVVDAYGRRGFPVHESVFSPGHLFLVQEQVRAITRCLRRVGRESLRDYDLLEVGCGTGRWLREFVQWGADPQRLTGVDLLPDRVALAATRCAPAVEVRVGNAGALPFADRTFDIVFQSTVLTSILDGAVRRRVTSEMRRVTRPGGIILSYDFRYNNPHNPDVRAVTHRELGELFAGCRIRVERVTLAPPLARRIAPYSWTLCTALACLPFLRTHLLAVVTVP